MEEKNNNDLEKSLTKYSYQLLVLKYFLYRYNFEKIFDGLA